MDYRKIVSSSLIALLIGLVLPTVTRSGDFIDSYLTWEHVRFHPTTAEDEQWGPIIVSFREILKSSGNPSLANLATNPFTKDFSIPILPASKTGIRATIDDIEYLGVNDKLANGKVVQSPDEDVKVASTMEPEHTELNTFNGESTVVYGDCCGRIEEVYLDSGRPTGRGLYVGGVLLGFSRIKNDRFYVCDSSRGLLYVDLMKGSVEMIVTEEPVYFCNSIVVNSAGNKVYFTDATDVRPWGTFKKVPIHYKAHFIKHAKMDREFSISNSDATTEVKHSNSSTLNFWHKRSRYDEHKPSKDDERPAGTDDVRDVPDEALYAYGYHTVFASKFDVFRNKLSGRLLEYDVITKKTTVLLKDLAFGNGMVLVNKERTLVVAETARLRLLRVDLEQPLTSTAMNIQPYWSSKTEKVSSARGQDCSTLKKRFNKFKVRCVRPLVPKLPGFPDNLSHFKDGSEPGSPSYLWVSLFSPMMEEVDPGSKVWYLPDFLRSLLVHLPEALKPRPVKHSFALKYRLDFASDSSDVEHSRESDSFDWTSPVEKGDISGLLPENVSIQPKVVDAVYDNTGESLGVVTMVREENLPGRNVKLFSGLHKTFVAKIESELTEG